MPTTCVWCGKTWEYICTNCRKKLISHQEICPVCHKVSEDFMIHTACCENIYYEGIIILWEFTSLVKKLIYKLKFWHKYDTVDFFAQKLRLGIQSNQHIYKSDYVSDIYISYVPSHRFRRYWIKWYNQSELLARKLSEISWLSLVDISKKIKHTTSQVKLNREQRLWNLIWSYKLVDNLTLDGTETVIIIDDITTTWATINQLAKTIKVTYPDIKIWWAVIARSNK